jgi:hypothetical protein
METITAAVTPKVGDILVSSWGYDQTNVDFYKVTKLSPSGKSVTIVRINSEVTGTGFMCGTSVPAVPHEVSEYEGEPMTKRVNLTSNGYSVNIASYASARLWNGQPRYTSWYA